MTTTTTPTTLTDAQLQAAHTLSAAYGHEWACALPLADLVGLGPDQIAALLEERFPLASDERWRRGISSPVLDGEGDVIHSTGSGRLQWMVQRDGGLTLYVYRPSPVYGDEGGILVLSAVLLPRPYSPETGGGWFYHRGWDSSDVRELPHSDPRRGVFALPRHLDALGEAVRALQGLNPNTEAVLSWIESLRPAAERAELAEARDRAYAIGATSIAAIDAAIAVLQELRRRYV